MQTFFIVWGALCVGFLIGFVACSVLVANNPRNSQGADNESE